MQRNGVNAVHVIRCRKLNSVRSSANAIQDPSINCRYGQFASDHMWMYGSQVDTWGASWTADELNNPNFGFQIQLRNIDQDTIEISMDRVEVIVYYTPLYSFCDANCLTFYIDKLEQKGRYVWHYPAGFDMVSASTSFQTIDLKITYASYGIHEICVDVYNYDGTYAETCCRKFLYQNILQHIASSE